MIDRRTLLAAGAAVLPAATTAAAGRASYRIIATEEAFAFPDWYTAVALEQTAGPEAAEARMLTPIMNNPMIRQGLIDFDHRLTIMDQDRVDMHLLSLTTPGVQTLERQAAVDFARTTNDRLAAIVRSHPTRFAALATVAPQDPLAAAAEVDRAMTSLGFNGVLINSYTNGEYLDHPKFEPLLAAMARNRAPLYIHPRAPSPQMIGPYLDQNLSGAIWGFAADTGLHAMRMIMSGVFDRHPDLTVVLGHMGEAIPYWFWRLDNTAAKAKAQAIRAGRQPTFTRLPSEYFRTNFYITTSGVNSHANLKFAIDLLGADRIMFAIDYPFESSADSVTFLRSAPISDSDRRRIAHGNAERVFGIKPA